MFNKNDGSNEHDKALLGFHHCIFIVVSHKIRSSCYFLFWTTAAFKQLPG